MPEVYTSNLAPTYYVLAREEELFTEPEVE